MLTRRLITSWYLSWAEAESVLLGHKAKGVKHDGRCLQTMQLHQFCKQITNSYYMDIVHTYQNKNNGPSVINTNYASTQRTLLFLSFTTLLSWTRIFFVSFVWIFGFRISEQKIRTAYVWITYCLFWKKGDLTFEWWNCLDS